MGFNGHFNVTPFYMKCYEAKQKSARLDYQPLLKKGARASFPTLSLSLSLPADECRLDLTERQESAWVN